MGTGDWGLGASLLLLLTLLVGCGGAPPSTATPTPAATETAVPPPTLTSPPPTPTPVAEQPVTDIPLAAPLNDPSAELSGLAWYGPRLILLPQYPDFAAAPAEGDGYLYALSRQAILAYLDGESDAPLAARPIPFSAPGLAADITGFEGYEAIAFAGERMFVTVEARTLNGMAGYLAAGEIAPDLSGLALDTGRVLPIESQSGSGNKAEESVLVAGDAVLTFHEANGTAVNPNPVAHRFDLTLAPAGVISFPALEYRLTDVTAVDENGRFWGVNYFFPGDRELRSAVDSLAERYGQGASHAQRDGVERLVAFQFEGNEIRLLEMPPIQLTLLPGDDYRNWEGIVRLEGRGFLLVTDKFPDTRLGFVPWQGP